MLFTEEKKIIETQIVANYYWNIKFARINDKASNETLNWALKIIYLFKKWIFWTSCIDHFYQAWNKI